MELTATFIIISTILCVILAGSIFILLRRELPSTSNKKKLTKNKIPNAPYIKNIKEENEKIYGAIYVNSKEYLFNYKKTDYPYIQKETNNIKNSLAIMIQSPYNDIIESRYNIIIHSLKELTKLTTINDSNLKTIAQELETYKNSLTNS